MNGLLFSKLFLLALALGGVALASRPADDPAEDDREALLAADRAFD